MPRYNKIYAGPATEVTPQVQEAPAVAATLPGVAVQLNAAGLFAVGAVGNSKLFVAQDNYLALRGVDVPWPVGDTMIGMEMLDEQFFNVRVPTGQNVLKGSAMAVNATGKFILATGAGTRIVAFSEEAYNNTTGEDQLVRVRAAKGLAVTA